MNAETVQRPNAPLPPRMEKRWWAPEFEVTVNGRQYVAPLVLMSADPRHPARDAAELWELERMRTQGQQRPRR